MPASRAILLTTEAVTRSLLVCLGLDQALAEFLVSTALGATAVLVAIVFVGFRARSHRTDR